ncbi:MAG: hypothetical protein ABF633_03505 [Clostridium sp.]|uniref:PD-(D/E)XK nuclease family protein n=1 Tax=Clostridium sp. TaxID=1506 RepID=UPI0039E8C49C
MGLAKKVDLKVEAEVSQRSKDLAGGLFNQFNKWHETEHWGDKRVEAVLLRQKEQEIEFMKNRPARPDVPCVFSPSGASKCDRELFFKALRLKQIEEDKYPYHRRWTRNATAVHEATQSDLLYMSMLMKNPDFTVKLAENGLPMWEENLKTHKIFEHNGARFAILGMMDGILTYKDGTDIGFEFKTKSNTLGQVGHYKMKAPAPYHLEQCNAYSLLFGLEEFVLMYESLPKDGWTKGAEAKVDIRTFYYKSTDEAKELLLDKFAEVTKAVEAENRPPMQSDKCLFCPYKYLCEGGK